MPAERYFTPDPLETGQVLFLEEKEFHHLSHVMRSREGDVVEIINGLGELAEGRIETLKKRHAAIAILEVKKFPPPKNEIILAQAIPRPQKMDIIIEKGTELGVTHFYLFPGILSERKEVSENLQQKLKVRAIAALKQCGRTWLPEIALKPPLDKWNPPEFPSFFGDIRKGAPLFHTAWESHHCTAFFVGPESGFDAREVALLESWGSKGVQLNPNILRTETAAIIAVGLIAHWQSIKI